MIKYSQMKLIVILLLLHAVFSSAFAAGRVEVSALPPSQYADTEAVTNVAINTWRNDVKNFTVRLALAESVSNCVQVAFGRDADFNGDLALDETDLVLSCRGECWCVEDVQRGRRYYEPANSGNPDRFLQLGVMTNADFVPLRAAFSNDVGVCFCELASAAPQFLFDRTWNLAKVTRRGVDAVGEWCRIDSDYRMFVIRVR